MRRLWCRWFGHDNIWTLDPVRPGEHIVTCLTCRDRAFSYMVTPAAPPPDSPPAPDVATDEGRG